MIDLSKLGITPGPWFILHSDNIDEPGHISICADGKDEPWYIARIWRDGPHPEIDGRVMAASYKMLFALISGRADDRLSAIKEATGKDLDEIRRMMG